MDLTIPDLSPIPFDPLNFRALEDKSPCATIYSHIFPPFCLEFGEELSPDSVLLNTRKVAVVDDGVNTGNECVIELTNAVGGEEQDTTIVFDHA